uniref:Uncharacterized protein n=1 Tax=Anguilla anguilla TaxID=7936 RepID=A0A0E9PCU6_ANGAN
MSEIGLAVPGRGPSARPVQSLHHPFIPPTPHD